MQLLLGEIPERGFFRARQSRAAMQPYMKLVQAVRLGDLNAFKVACGGVGCGVVAGGLGSVLCLSLWVGVNVNVDVGQRLCGGWGEAGA